MASPVRRKSRSMRSQTMMAFSRTPALLRPAIVSLMEARDDEMRGAAMQLILMPTTSSGETSEDQAPASVRSPVSSLSPASKARWTAAGV